MIGSHMIDRPIFIFFILLACLTGLAGCSPNPSAKTPTATAEVYMPTRSVATVQPTEAAPTCSNILAYYEYEDLYFYKQAAPGETFTAEWEVMNYSDCVWDERYHLYFISGDQMGAPDFISIQRVPIGSRTKITVELTAPEEPGEYQSEWKMFGDDNRFFGDSLVAEIDVVE